MAGASGGSGGGSGQGMSGSSIGDLVTNAVGTLVNAILGGLSYADNKKRQDKLVDAQTNPGIQSSASSLSQIPMLSGK